MKPDYGALYKTIRDIAMTDFKNAPNHEYIDWSWRMVAALREAFEGGEEASDGEGLDQGGIYASEAQADGAGEAPERDDWKELYRQSCAKRDELGRERDEARAERDKALADLAEARVDAQYEKSRHRETCQWIQDAHVILKSVGAPTLAESARSVMAALEAEKLKTQQQAVELDKASETASMQVSEARRESLGVIEGLQGQLTDARKDREALRAEMQSLDIWHILGGQEGKETLWDAARRVVRERAELQGTVEGLRADLSAQIHKTERLARHIYDLGESWCGGPAPEEVK